MLYELDKFYFCFSLINSIFFSTFRIDFSSFSFSSYFLFLALFFYHLSPYYVIEVNYTPHLFSHLAMFCNVSDSRNHINSVEVHHNLIGFSEKQSHFFLLLSDEELIHCVIHYDLVNRILAFH